MSRPLRVVLFARQQEQKVDVGAGSQRAAAIAARGDDGDLLQLTRICPRIQLLPGQVIKRADDFILDIGKIFAHCVPLPSAQSRASASVLAAFRTDLRALTIAGRIFAMS